MKTEDWALLVSALALVVSVGIPILQARQASAQSTAARRSLLLQTILDVKTTTYVSSHELLDLLRRHGAKMESSQRENLSTMYPRMREHYAQLEQLHEAWADFKDNASLMQIEEVLVQVNVAAAEARETAKIIETGRRSFEDA